MAQADACASEIFLITKDGMKPWTIQGPNNGSAGNNPLD